MGAGAGAGLTSLRRLLDPLAIDCVVDVRIAVPEGLFEPTGGTIVDGRAGKEGCSRDMEAESAGTSAGRFDVEVDSGGASIIEISVEAFRLSLFGATGEVVASLA